MRFRVIALPAGIIIVCGLLFAGHYDLAQHNMTHDYQIRETRLTKDIRKKENRKPPTIRKTVPSSYKKMKMDGNAVVNAENVILRAEARTHGKINFGQPSYVHAVNTLKQYLTTGGTDDDSYYFPWTEHYDDRVRLVPGESNSYGIYYCAFEVYGPNHRVDNFNTAKYNPSTRRFSHFDPFGDNTAQGRLEQVYQNYLHHKNDKSNNSKSSSSRKNQSHKNKPKAAKKSKSRQKNNKRR